jgi:streptogramin lyase
MLAAGTYTNDIQASFAANSGYIAATAYSTLTITSATPTITFSVQTHHTIDSPFTVSASSNSSGTLTYSVVSGPANISGATVTLTGAGGAVQLMVSQAASGIYATGSQTASFNVVAGSVWLGNAAGSLSIFGSDGAALLNATGAGLGTIPKPLGEAFDSSGNLWVASTNGVSAFTANGTAVQSTAFTSGGISSPVSLAVDGAGLVWVVNSNSTLSVLNNAGIAVSPSTGYPATASGTPGGLMIDLSGNVWVTNQTANTVTEILGAATPAAPASTALVNGTTGAKP